MLDILPGFFLLGDIYFDDKSKNLLYHSQWVVLTN